MMEVIGIAICLILGIIIATLVEIKGYLKDIKDKLNK